MGELLSDATNKRRSRGRPRNVDGDSPNAEILRQIGESGSIDRDSSTPLWVQLKNVLSEKITSDAMRPDDCLPSEQAMCDIFNVSRPVVRAALGSLADDGLLMKVPRRGIFIAKPAMETSFLTSNVSVHSDLEARGHKVTARAFEFGRAVPDEDERRVFNLPPGGTVVRVGRIYRSDGQPITHTRISLPGHKVPEMEKLDIEGQSIFQILKDHYGLVSKRAERWFTAAMPDEQVSRRLELAPSQPLIFIESIAYDAANAPLEYYRAFYNSKVARIHVSTGGVRN